VIKHRFSVIFLRYVQWSGLSAERSRVLFDLATARLLERKVLLPGVTTLERLVARIRDRTAQRLWRLLAKRPTAEQERKLEALLQVAEGERISPQQFVETRRMLDELFRVPTTFVRKYTLAKARNLLSRLSTRFSKKCTFSFR